MLVKAGLTSGGVPDKDKKERDFMFQTFGPNQVNLSGLKRLLSGGDPTFKQGDVAISYMPLGLLGAQLGVVTEGYKTSEKGKANIDYFLISFPLLGKVYKNYILAWIAANLGNLIGSGVGIIKTLTLV